MELIFSSAQLSLAYSCFHSRRGKLRYDVDKNILATGSVKSRFMIQAQVIESESSWSLSLYYAGWGNVYITNEYSCRESIKKVIILIVSSPSLDDAPADLPSGRMRV